MRHKRYVFTMPVQQYERLRRYAYKLDLSISETVRRILDAHIPSEVPTPPKEGANNGS